MDNHSVCYKFLAFPNDQDKASLKDFYLNANKASDVFSDLFLNLFGGIKPKTLTYARFKLGKRKDKREEKYYPDAVTLFFNWFTFEDSQFTNPNLRLSSEEVYPTFVSYCKELNVKIDNNWAESIKATINSSDGLRTWVNRFKGNKLLKSELCMSESTLEWFFKNPEFPLQDKEVAATTYCRSLLSILWGEDAKTNWNMVGDKVRKLRELTNTPINLLRKKCCDALGITTTMMAKDINKKVFGKPGRPNELSLFLSGNYDARIEGNKFGSKEFQELLNKTLSNSDFRSSMPKEFKNGLSAKLLVKLQKETGLPYVFSFFGEFASKAIQRIRSHRSNSLNAIFRRLNINREKPPIHDDLEQAIIKWQVDKQQLCLTDGDIAGLKDVESYYDDNLEHAVISAEKNSKSRRANYAFLKMAAKYPGDNVFVEEKYVDYSGVQKTRKVRKWFYLMRAYQRYSQNEYDFYRLKTPILAKFQLKPDHPSYGKSRPNSTFSPEKKEYFIEILTPQGIKKLNILVANKRAYQEIYNATGEEIAPRRTKLVAAAYEIPLDKVKSAATEEGMKLVFNDEKVYFYQTYKLPSKRIETLEEIKTLNPRCRFLALDPGIRESMTYAVGETFRQSPDKEKLLYHVTCKCGHEFGKKKTGPNDAQEICGCGALRKFAVPHVKISDKWMKIIDCGSIKEHDFVRNDTKRSVCRLHSTSSKDTNKLHIWDKEKHSVITDTVCGDYWNYLRSLKLVDKDCPSEYHQFIKDCVNVLSWYWRCNESPDLTTLEVLTTILKSRSHHSGDNSYVRILSIKRLKSIYQTAVKIISEPNVRKMNVSVVPQWLSEGLEYATKKVKNLRNERARRIVNLVCQKAIEHKVKIVFLEDTCLDVHMKMPKAMLRRIDIWTPRHVKELCEMQLNPLGIRVQLMHSKLSSHTDFYNHDSEQPRYDNLTSQMIRAEVDYYRKIKKVIGKRMGIYLREIKGILASLGTNMEECNIHKSMKFPRNGGKFFDSELLGMIDADENAAMYFLIKGVRWLASDGVAKKKNL